MRTLLTALTAALALTAPAGTAQPQFPQHSIGVPSVQVPLIQNHITNLGATIAGRPVLAAPGARPIYPRPIFVGGGGAWGGNGWGGGGWYPMPVAVAPQQPVVVVQQTAPPPQPVLVVNPDYKPEVAKPVMREYSNISNPYADFQPETPKVYLLALKDGTLRQAVAFWVEKDKLHYVRPDHKQDSMVVSEIDRDATRRFNSERGIEIRLPN
jgi:hypothetical protein